MLKKGDLDDNKKKIINIWLVASQNSVARDVTNADVNNTQEGGKSSESEGPRVIFILRAR